MAKKKKDRLVIKLVDKEPGPNGEYFPPSIYWTKRNKNTAKLKLKKYNPFKRVHTEHIETK
ncbi:MAG: 50S ribosomal protein L33 [Candidatus Caenarcaniphilales bacterium]|nr:50S ribosomal protein L33 [Candidatus Caenarcaniphilales bacterium]